MNAPVKSPIETGAGLTPKAIRQTRADNPKMRERDLAMQLGISEAELLAAHCGAGVTRVEPRINALLTGLEGIGEVMALTRNESAVHEKIGVYDKVIIGPQHALVLGEDIDLRIFPKQWTFGFAVEKRDGETVRRSLQFFDAAGDAVHKVHLRPSSNLYAYQWLVEELAAGDQDTVIQVDRARVLEDDSSSELPSVDLLRERWSAMTDVHEFFGILRKLKLSRRQAVHLIGEDYAWRLDNGALTAMLHHAVQEEIPIMCFVGSKGCIQIHSGPIYTVKPMGPWINVLDPTFNLHLRTDHVSELWAVRKPTKEGYVSSIETFDADGGLIAQFFGKRHEGEDERADWRTLVKHLPRIPQSSAA